MNTLFFALVCVNNWSLWWPFALTILNIPWKKKRLTNITICVLYFSVWVLFFSMGFSALCRKNDALFFFCFYSLRIIFFITEMFFFSIFDGNIRIYCVFSILIFTQYVKLKFFWRFDHVHLVHSSFFFLKKVVESMKSSIIRTWKLRI